MKIFSKCKIKLFWSANLVFSSFICPLNDYGHYQRDVEYLYLKTPNFNEKFWINLIV